MLISIVRWQGLALKDLVGQNMAGGLVRDLGRIGGTGE